MKIWFKRWLAYMFIPFGFVLLALPISTQRVSYQEREALFLGVTGKTTEITGKDSLLPVIQENYLSGFPSLKTLVDGITQEMDRFGWEHTPILQRPGFPVEEWERFVSMNAPGGKFLLWNRIFEGRISLTGMQVYEEIPLLEEGRRITGLILIFAGLYSLFSAYPKRGSGIYIGRKRDVIIWDTVITGFAVLFSLWFLDMAFAQLFGVSPKWKEEISWGMGTFMVVFANPFLALATSAMSAQVLQINSDGIKLKGLFIKSEVKWPDMETIRVTESFSPRKSAGVASSHRLIKFLEIRGRSGRLSVMEPPSASTKRQIMGEIREKAPVQFRNSIDMAEKEWVSLF